MTIETRIIAKTFFYFQKQYDAEKSDIPFADKIVGSCEHRIDLTAHIAEVNELINKFN